MISDKQTGSGTRLAEVVGRRVRDLRERSGLTLRQLSERTGIAVSSLSEIETGRNAPRLETVVRLAQALNVPFDVLISLPDETIESYLRTIETPENIGALQLWLERCRRYLQIEALLGQQKSLTPAYPTPEGSWDKQVALIEQLAQAERRRLGLGNEPIADMVAVVEHAGLRVVGADLPPDDLDGALFQFPQKEAAVALINRSKPPLRQRFTLAHEYAHLLLHREHRVVWDRSIDRVSSIEERQANAFAAAFLMPAERINGMYDEYKLPRRRTQLPIFGWVAMRRRFGVSYAALAWRLFNLGYVNEEERDWVLQDGSRQLTQMERALYGDVSEPPPIPTLTDRLRTLVLHAYLKDEISASTTAELLESALTPIQEYLTAQRIPAAKAKEFFEFLEKFSQQGDK